MSEKPLWIDCLMRSTNALTSFKEYVKTEEGSLLEEMRVALQADKLDSARVSAGESIVGQKLRNQIAIYEREEQQNAVIQKERG